MIEFQNVSKTYPNGTHALQNVSLSIDKGEFVFIVGASGAGKSTFLKLIMHEEIPTSGEIVINGNKLTKLRRRDVPYLRRHMGIVFQDFRLIEKMTVFDNVAFAMRAVGESTATIKKRVPYVLNLVGLSDKMKNKPNELSGGEQQRVSLARALVNNPEIIIADEPTGNVDPELSHEIIELLNEINAMGTTVLVVTHEHELVREFNQRVVTIDNGKVIGDTKNGRFAVGVYDDYEEEYADDAVYADEAGYADDYDGYTGDADFSDEEIIESYEGLGYDDDADVGEFEPQYPDNVVILPDDDERLGS
ncbi:MAG: cell division ATP-binding protein FtsE [Ruminococcus sp.]|nr:cell division ATP-binding protein FtsE [Ruminococcus sp.]MBQ4239033.1 cell division ATP-binding protein FtsE [Ruminococcus sp.]